MADQLVSFIDRNAPVSPVDRLKQLWGEAGQLIEELDLSGNPSLGHEAREQPYISLKTVLRNVADLVDVLHSKHAPIHRVPTEILARIFSFVRTPLDTAGPGYMVRRSYIVQDPRALHPVLLVCRKWRDIALNTPLLWSHVLIGPGVDDAYIARSASVPLTVFIPDTIYAWKLNRSSWRGIASWSYPYEPFFATLKSLGKVHDRIRKLHINIKSAKPPALLRGAMIGFLSSLDASELEECTIEHALYLNLDVGPRLTLFSGGCDPYPSKLRVLQLALVPFLPANKFPALTSFSLSYASSAGRTWGASDLASFLSGSPKLEKLFISNVELERRAAMMRPDSTKANLKQLRELWLEFPPMIAVTSFERLVSIIAIPSDCHILLATFSTARHDIVDQLLNVHLCREGYTRLRIRAFKNEGTTLHLVPSSGCGSLSIGVSNTNNANRNDPWRDLRAQFDRSYPWCYAIEELWLEFTEDDFYNGIRCILGRFPRLKSLVVSQPCYASPGRWYSRIHDALHLLRPYSSGSVACPDLDTFCINIPAYCKDIETVKQILASRAPVYPVRRLVVGYSPMLELDVLAEVFSLEELVEEFVCEELPPVGRGSVPSNWLLSIPKVFGDGILYANWPKWSRAPAYPPTGMAAYHLA